MNSTLLSTIFCAGLRTNITQILTIFLERKTKERRKICLTVPVPVRSKSGGISEFEITYIVVWHVKEHGSR
jgi:hypothetical protein